MLKFAAVIAGTYSAFCFGAGHTLAYSTAPNSWNWPWLIIAGVLMAAISAMLVAEAASVERKSGS